MPGRPKTDRPDAVWLAKVVERGMCRQMLQAMIAGQRNPKVPAEMAHGVLRRKTAQLRQALTGHFDDHHAFICATMRLRRIDALAADIADLDARNRPLFAAAVAKLDGITGVGLRSAQEIIAELGVDMTVFPHRRTPSVLGEFSHIDATSPRPPQGQLHQQRQPVAGRHPR